MDFKVWKSVICGKSLDLKIARTLELHMGADLQLAITSARINIFHEVKSSW